MDIENLTIIKIVSEKEIVQEKKHMIVSESIQCDKTLYILKSEKEQMLKLVYLVYNLIYNNESVVVYYKEIDCVSIALFIGLLNKFLYNRNNSDIYKYIEQYSTCAKYQVELYFLLILEQNEIKRMSNAYIRSKKKKKITARRTELNSSINAYKNSIL